MSIYAQYGCGPSAGEGWLNFDASPTLRIERLPALGKIAGKLSTNSQPFPREVRYGDIVKGLPLKDGSVAGLYASHVLEHLSFGDCRKALANSLRVLRPGGIFRLIVPDLRARAKAYVEAEGDPGAAHAFMRSTYLGRSDRSEGLTGRLRHAFGNSEHLWMYDFASMKSELEAAGFAEIRRAEFGDCDDPMFQRVEKKDRFVSDGIDEVAIQACRPATARSKEIVEQPGMRD